MMQGEGDGESMVKRRVFISFYQGDRTAVDAFIDRWTVREGVFSPRVLGVSSNDDFISSTNPEYVMTQIREKYLGDSTVTIVLLGTCTHSRRYVDWEIKTSLRMGKYTPNGLIGIRLSSATSVHLPERFNANWEKGEGSCYARLRSTPSSASELTGWIEDAVDARTSRDGLITNSADMFKYNKMCLVHKETH